MRLLVCAGEIMCWCVLRFLDVDFDFDFDFDFGGEFWRLLADPAVKSEKTKIWENEKPENPKTLSQKVKQKDQAKMERLRLSTGSLILNLLCFSLSTTTRDEFLKSSISLITAAAPTNTNLPNHHDDIRYKNRNTILLTLEDAIGIIARPQQHVRILVRICKWIVI